MKSRLLVAAVACLGYAILNATPANAEDMYFYPTGASADWESDDSWYTSGCNQTTYAGDGNYPDSTETVRICAGKTVGVTTSTPEAKTVYLETSGDNKAYIEIDPNARDATLTLGGGETEAESTLSSGTKITLKDDTDGTYVAELTFATVDHRFRGLGSIVGEDELAQIDIPGSRTMTIDVDDDESPTGWVSIVGMLQIMGSGTFVNEGQVHANANGTLDMAVTGDINDTAEGAEQPDRWQVTTHSNAVLRFRTEPSGQTQLDLSGSFTVSDGTLRPGCDCDGGDDIDVVTTGRLTQTGGTISAGVDDSFVFNAPE